MKKTISLITAFCLSFFALATPLFNTGAIVYDSSPIKEFCKNEPGTYENGNYLLDLGDMFFQKKTFKNYTSDLRDDFLPDYFDAYIMKYDAQTSRTYYNGQVFFVYTRCAEISFTVPFESADKVNEYIRADEELNKYYNDIMWCVRKYQENSTYKYCIELYGNDAYERARKIKQDMQSIKDIEQFTFTPIKENIRPILPFFLTYCPNISDFKNSFGLEGVELAEIKETLETYVAENNLDYTVETFKGLKESFGDDFGDFYGYKLVPNGDYNLDEAMELSKKIYADIGYNSWYAYDMRESGLGGEGTYSSESIDMSNNVDGDANCDGEYTIADATAILQSLGNPDKYGLSLQGEFNADIYNVGDGVTPMDALEVQKAMAKYE